MSLAQTVLALDNADMATLTLNTDGHLHLALQLILSDAPTRFVTLANRPPPAAEVNRRIHEVGRRALTLAQLLTDILGALRPQVAVAQQDQALKDGFRELTYALAEYGEFVEKIPDIAPGANKAAKADYRSAIKGRIRTSKVICNKLKHEGNRLLVLTNTHPDGLFAPGVALFRYAGDGIEPNPELHDEDNLGFSAALLLKALLSDFLVADELAAKFCRTATGLAQPSPDQAGEGDQDLLAAIRLTDAIYEASLGEERSQVIKTVRLKDNVVEYGKLARRDPLPPFGEVKVSWRIDGDGHSRSFKVLPTRRKS